MIADLEIQPPFPPIAEIIDGNRIVSVNEETDDEGCDWLVIEFETGHVLHVPDGGLVMVHPQPQ